MPIHPNARITEAALRAGARAREAGRRLVRHGTDTDDVVVGLALLAAVGTVDDVPYIQTIGLLSCTFGPLAADAPERLPDGAESLLWLADRVAGWGRAHVVEALCRLAHGHSDVRHWLLRRAADGDFLNGYFAGEVARASALDQALTGCPHAEEALAAHLRHLDRLGPSPSRYCIAAMLARNLGEHGDEGSVAPVRRWRTHRDGYLALPDRDDWFETARNAPAADDPEIVRLVETVASDLGLRTLDDPAPSSEG
ncbi:hypothetical protein [Streptomyces sp. CB02400]|uniref:hypothetical protein n=1 Tax=Streptomyces sp. CB02400 TaxID=1703944 RepID=UPI000D1A7646|nr:hypothetical protein [Streptomyces sp. CB02400]